VLAMMISMLAVLFFPPLAQWLPQYLGYCWAGTCTIFFNGAIEPLFNQETS